MINRDLFQICKPGSILKWISVKKHIKKLKKKCHVIILINAERHITKIQHSVTIKTLKKLGTEWTSLFNKQYLHLSSYLMVKEIWNQEAFPMKVKRHSTLLYASINNLIKWEKYFEGGERGGNWSKIFVDEKGWHLVDKRRNWSQLAE